MQRHEDGSGRWAHRMAEGKDQQGEEAVARASLRSISNAKNQTLGKRGALPRLEPGQNQGITPPPPCPTWGPLAPFWFTFQASELGLRLQVSPSSWIGRFPLCLHPSLRPSTQETAPRSQIRAGDSQGSLNTGQRTAGLCSRQRTAGI